MTQFPGPISYYGAKKKEPPEEQGRAAISVEYPQPAATAQHSSCCPKINV